MWFLAMNRYRLPVSVSNGPDRMDDLPISVFLKNKRLSRIPTELTKNKKMII